MSLRVIRNIGDWDSRSERTVATIGTFDGLHRGHQAILQRLMTAAARERGLALALTFEPHPRELVTPDTAPPLLTVWEEKVKLFEKYMDGSLLVLEFNAELMNMTAEEFTRDILMARLRIGRLIVGYDHAFGKNRSGTINDLMELSRRYGFELEIVDPVMVEGRPISSSRVRHLLQAGQYAEARAMLGHAYPITGTVTKGIGLGQKIGFPTANLKYSARKQLPPEGVYSCRVERGEVVYYGMMFIGQNHFNPEAGISVEVNIFDLAGDIYGERLILYPEKYIRENRIYRETGELVKQLIIDKQNVMQIRNEGESRNVR